MPRTWLGREDGRVVDITEGEGIQGKPGPRGPRGLAGADGAGITTQPAITNVSRSGLVTEQITALQNKADETLTVLRNAGVIQT